ncbi:MAG: hypothetical protein ACHRXM_34950 [Isosphaerales bacterium]
MRTSSKMAVSRAMGRMVLVLVSLGGGGVGRGDPISSAQKDLVQAERKLEAARGRVTATAEQLSAAQSLRMARAAVLHACQAAHHAVERVLQDAEKAADLARSDAARADQLPSQATQAVERSRRDMERARDRFLNRPLVAYDRSQHGRLTLNVMTGAFDLSLDTGPGVKLGAGDLEALLAGQFKLPDVDPLELAAETLGIHGRLTSNYVEVQASLAAEHGAANVYLLSRRFIEWASPERLAGDFTTAVLTRGGSVEGELALARRQIQLEYEDFSSWLRLKGVKDLGPEPCAALVDLIRTRSCPRLGLSVKTRQVDVTHRFESAGSTEVPFDFLQRLRPKGQTGDRATWEMTEKRPALAVVWNGPAWGHGSLASQLEDDFRLPAPAIDKLPGLLPSKTDPRIRRLVGWTAQLGLPAIDAAARPRRLARAAIGPRKEDIDSAAGPDRLIVDLRYSDFGEIVATFLSQLALGNSKCYELNVLELDQSNGRLEAEFTLHHRFVWPSIREAQTNLRAALGPVGTGVDDLADRLPDASFNAARKLYREENSKAHEASARPQEVHKKAHEAADRVATKQRELATFAGDLTRARTDLRAASEFEARARQEAQAACALMIELDAKVRFARDQVQSLEHPVKSEVRHRRKP